MRGLGTDLNDARDEEAALADEHHLQVALDTGGVIPTPGMTQVPYVYYAQLYPPARWEDPVSYVQTTQTSVLAGEECTYYMDEVDKQWLDKNNRQARGENGQDKDPNIGVPISISKDEFELVMGLLEKFTDQQVLEGDGPDFTLYRCFFLAPLPANIFMPYTVPSWTPPPARLVCIACTIYPHWKHRRSLVNGHRIRPSLNYYEKDFLDQAYKCFRERPHKKAGIAESHNPWNARRPLADRLDETPPLETPESIKLNKLLLLPLSAPTPDPKLQNITTSSLGSKRPRTASSVERKEARAHRNRIAAQNFRDRRKAQFSYLERRVSELEEENRQLRAGLVAPAQQDPRKVEEQECEHAKARENEELRERIKTLEKGWDDVMRALATQVLSTNIAPPAPAPASEPPSTTTTEPPASQRPPQDSPASP
ncbi:hypothetical protein B0H14DRAFT_3870755 [Mycena olivaceomarginata]|nr:hypothetical protein B0H14DRAFT_3870755 [Mycena olivaceomarginata]